MTGGAIGALANMFFNKKKAPNTVQYTPVDLQAEQQKSIGGNISALPDLDTLLSQSNTFQQKQANSLMESALPGYSSFSQNLLGTASNLAKNPYEIPQSAVDQLMQYANENNLAGGTGASSAFSHSNALRSLGVNELQYGQNNIQTAMQALSVLTGTAPRVSPMSPLSFMVTPQQQAQNQQYTNTLQQQIAQGGANAQTAAKNWNTQNLWDNFMAFQQYLGASADSGYNNFMNDWAGMITKGRGMGGMGGMGG